MAHLVMRKSKYYLYFYNTRDKHVYRDVNCKRTFTMTILNDARKGSTLVLLVFHAVVTIFIKEHVVVVATETIIKKSSSSTKVPLQVFILAGQSNMVGMGSIDHLDLLIQKNHLSTKNDHSSNNNEYRTTLWNGTNYIERDDVYITYQPQSSHGKLTVSRTAGYASGNAFGPEVMFGWTIVTNNNTKNEENDESDMTATTTTTTTPVKVLLIKVAYGGRDLAIDFRPPSAGYGNYSGIDPTKYGWEYRTMIHDTYAALATISDVVPNYDPIVGYTISGFVWFQGWNDVLDWNKVNEYESNLAHLIRDVRTDLGIDNLPFVIGELGMHGLNPQGREAGRVLALRTAQSNVCNDPEFQSTTAFVPTALYAVVNDTVTYNGIHHYYGRADTYYHIGKAFGTAMLHLLTHTTGTMTSMK